MIKKAFIYLFLFILVGITNAQTFECKIVENDLGYLSYQMRETSGINTPTTSTDINDITFVLRYPSGSIDIDLICSSNAYKIFDGLSGEQTLDGFDYHYWNASASPAINPASNWVQNEWEEICTFKAIGATGSDLFEVAPDNWAGRSLNWNQTVSGTANDFLPVIIGSGINYNYPTVVYNLVWTGASDYPEYWDWSENWETSCGDAGSVPNSGDNCVIPVVSNGNYPSKIYDVTGMGKHQPMCDNLLINTGASLSTDYLDDEGPDQVTYTINNALLNHGTINIIPNSQLTISGNTYLDAAECLVIQSDATGTGSFIDNGTITYGTGGSAKVQTYLSNAATAPNFHFHLVGPTVNTTGTGVQLSAFNVADGNTFAYNYDVSTDTWTNFSALTDAVSTATGIGLSTNDGTPHTMEMTGNLVTGNVNSVAMSTAGSKNNLLSNPYPSAIYWNDINDNDVSDLVYVYDATYSGGNYRAYNENSGGTINFDGYIQVGQGFFVEATNASAFTFENDDRHHSNESFYKTTSFVNRLDVRASGNGFTDGILVHFYENASSGYDPNEDAEKKMSYNENATQLWSVNENNSKLSINALPLELLDDNYSVPLSFVCNIQGDYSLNFLGLESFETGTEIWLEDKIAGGEWVSVNLNPNYSFTASADDPADRFVIHFFGPTAIDENGNPVTVDIYSHNKYAYVRNNTNETIKKIGIYTISGKLLFETDDITFKNSKYYVSERTGYYAIRVITDKNVYTNKVFISK